MRKYFMSSSRLGFSNWVNDDFVYAKKLWTDSKVTNYISANGSFSLREVEDRFIDELINQRDHDIAYWPIFIKDNDEFVGCCGLRPYQDDILEIGFHILPQYWNQGYAYEAANQVIEYAFDKLKVKKIFAGHNPNNEVSKYLLNKLGFKFYQEELYQPTGLMHPSYFLENDL